MTERRADNTAATATFEAGEIGIVLSHYDLGVVESITPIVRGSRRSPKLGIVAESGKYLLKRRAPGRSSVDRVRTAHAIQLLLRERGFPAPAIVRARSSGTSYVQLRETVYELFEFIPGASCSGTAADAEDAGRMLARFHETATVARTYLDPTRGGYHDALGVRTGLCRFGSAGVADETDDESDEEERRRVIDFLLASYEAASATVRSAGWVHWPEVVIHGDWHPGNLLCRQERVVAVIDFDSVRLGRRMADVANGALQFSILAAGAPWEWPDRLDEDRLRAFLRGYEEVAVLTPAERAVLTGLMTESLIAECVAPIRETGAVGPWSGMSVLRAVGRKVRWMVAQRDRLDALVTTA